jgi:hypothetical protein
MSLDCIDSGQYVCENGFVGMKRGVILPLIDVIKDPFKIKVVHFVF